MTLEAVAIAANVPHDITHPVSNNGTTRYVYAPEHFGKQYVIEQIKAALAENSGVAMLVITSNSHIVVNYTGYMIELCQITVDNAIINIGSQRCGYTENGVVTGGWPYGIYDPYW